MDITQFDFYLPEHLIAQTPLKDRLQSRLLVLGRETGTIEHRSFQDVIEYLHPGDVLILNDTRVLPARLYGIKKGTGARIEVLLLKSIGDDRWECLVRPGKRAKIGTEIDFILDDEASLSNPIMSAVVEEETEAGGRIIRFQYEGIFYESLERLGQMPLPPYIKETLEEKERYQTVYARHRGSVAAPTAGLHFTESFLDRIQQKGVNTGYLTLHVGLGTFRPVSVSNIEEHEMHAEYYEIPEETVQLIRQAKADGRRVVAVGTTSCRTLETVGQKFGEIVPDKGWTDIFIYPGYEFKVIDGLITNFHLPESTLLMLVSALAGRENVLRAYAEAVQQEYRFFSFGDAMLIL